MQPSAHTFEPPLFFVINDGSGRQDSSATRQAIDSAMRSAARRYQIFGVEDISSLDATIQRAVAAAKKENGVVVAVGGDGTINVVATAALADHCLFGALPQGTFNYFGRTHGIPEEIDAALEDLLQGKPSPVQVGLVNERIFLVNASVGFYPELLEDREAFKQRYGRSRLVALWAAIVTAFGDHRYLDMSLELTGKRVNFQTTTLFIGNNHLQLEQVGMPQAEAVKQGQLAAIAVKPMGTMAMLWLATRGALGKLGDADNVMAFSFRSLRVAPLGLFRGKRAAHRTEPTIAKKNPRKHRIKVAVDGEIMWLNAPLEFRVSPEPLLLIKRNHAVDPNHHVNGSLIGESVTEPQRAAQARMMGDTT
ncbi:diacylglycerol kinase [Candidimonas sp. SYP-B2681]|uniref:diacylglycerol/lipid kinase family protein n=1 Tax=Candidimonas sp. SYP-B2681 TaxID=2497686 RepID=UPI000F881864|nr:diacylglycerol kinase family protein [Candidimonas sp. SYP-B2681]RTZ47469.1 diacylglycerol kinase [Candidimonas sp. SYP-B2681]